MNDFGQVIAPRTVRLERLIAASPEQVWPYLVEADKRRRWLADGEMEPREGGKVELTWRNWELSDASDPPPAKHAEQKPHSMTGAILEYDPPNVLAFSWPQSGQMTEVRIELTAKGSKTLLSLTHTGLPSRGNVVGVSAGWHAHLGHLVALAEGRPTGKFWALFQQVEAEYEARTPADA